ncbi:MAG: tetratricopeptide repeat protein [Methanothrix sp.]|nr:MAG: tetratricopeptide repeat protein [Methanothrix sp.]
MAKDEEGQGDNSTWSDMKFKAHAALLLTLLLSTAFFTTTSCEAISADDWLNSSKTFYIAGDLDNALYCAERAIEIDPSFANAWLFKGASLREEGKLRASIASYNRALQINPKYIDAWNSKGMTLENLGRYEEAINCYDRIIQIEKDSGASDSLRDATISKGRVLRELYRYDESIECYDRLARYNDTLALSEKGITLAYQKKYDKAMQCFNEALNRTKDHQDDDSYIRAEIYMGIAFLFLNNSSSALGCFDEATKSGKSYDRIWTAWFCKAVVLKNLGHTDEAERAFQEAANLRMKGIQKKSQFHGFEERIRGLYDILRRTIS